MSGFYRGSQRKALTRNEAAIVIRSFIGEQEIAAIFAAQDPFQIACECPGHPAGHYPIRSAGEIVCAHDGCGKVFLR